MRRQLAQAQPGIREEQGSNSAWEKAQTTLVAGFPSLGDSPDGPGGRASSRSSAGMLDDEDSEVEEEIEAYQQVSRTRDCTDSSSRLRLNASVLQICSFRNLPYQSRACVAISV
jgi:hypothetical protein